MARTSNRIENLGELRLHQYEDLKDGWQKVLTKHRNQLTQGTSERMEVNTSLILNIVEKPPHFRVHLRIYFDDVQDFLSLLRRFKGVRTNYLFDVTKEGQWNAFYLAELDDEAEDFNPEQYHTGPLDKEWFEEEVLSFSKEKIGRLFTKLASSISFEVEGHKLLHIGFPTESNVGYFEMGLAKAPYLEFCFDTHGIRDVTNFVTSLARKMSKWWKEINAMPA